MTLVTISFALMEAFALVGNVTARQAIPGRVARTMTYATMSFATTGAIALMGNATAHQVIQELIVKPIFLL